MKLTIHIASAAVSLTLIAAALPGAALAKSAAPFEDAGAKGNPAVQTTAKDAPKVQGWQSGEGEMSDEDCQGFADQIQGAIDAGIEDLETNDVEGALASLDFGESIESLANESGCVISYPEKTNTPGAGAHAEQPDSKGGVAAQDQGSDTSGDDKDTACVQTNNAVNEVLDAAGAAFDANDMEWGFALLDLVDAMETDAAAEGCTIKYT